VLRGFAILRSEGVAVGANDQPAVTVLASVWQSDAWLFALAAALLALLQVTSLRPLRAALRAGLSGLLVMMVADFVIYSALDTRLSWGRGAIYVVHPGMILAFGTEWLGSALAAWAAIATVAAIMALPLLLPLPRGDSRWKLAALAGAGAIVFAWIPVSASHIDRWQRDNVLWLNRPNPEHSRYTAAPPFVPAPESRRALTHAPERRNVILVIIESWSSYQSKAFGGLSNWTPELDKIARGAIRFDQFHAGGYNTNEGLINLLGGARLWLPFAARGELTHRTDRWRELTTLPRVFHRHGYHSAFLTSGPRDFTGKAAWVHAIGFDEMEGGESPHYAGWPRPNFDAAPDEALYRRALAWLEAPHPQPFFLTLETVSSHLPCIDPATGQQDIEACFRYTDHWTAWFIAELQRRGFLESGIVLVTGDHRAMVPVSPDEKQRFGGGFSARIPLVVLDRRDSGGRVVSRRLHQADLLPSFRHWLGEPLTLDESEASLFEDAGAPGSVILHRRGRERGWIDVLTATGGYGVVRARGDATKFTESQGIDAATQQRLLGLIARERIQWDP
jgi:arylsulfatase A-like enzyme